VNTAEDRRKAGIFLLISLALLLVVTGTLAGVRFLSRDKSCTVEFYESVAGLEPSSPVKYNGVPVGSVKAIRIDTSNLKKTLVDLTVRPDVPIKIDTRAKLQPQGITGISYVELEGGSIDAPDLEAGDVIPSSESFTSKIGLIAKDLSELVSRLNQFVAANEEHLTIAIKNIGSSAESVRAALDKVDRVMAKIESAVDRGAATVDEARKAIEEVRNEVRTTGEAVRRTIGEVEATVKDPELRGLAAKAGKTLDLASEKLAAADFAALIDKVSAAVDEFRRIEVNLDRASAALAETAEDGRTDVAAVLADVRVAAEHVKAATQMLKDDPTRLLKGRPSDAKPFPDPMPPVPEDHK
jgi:phospholipid/cholesterol/gamma-HCH transport system substrate-binding protein